VSERKRETTIDRATLYELVWSKPTAYLAQEFGLSDVAIGKICRALNIPKPPRGYWAKVRRGQRVQRPALPSGSDPDARITIKATVKRERPKEVEIDTTTSTALLPLHPLVVRTKAELAHAEPSQEGLYFARGSGALMVDVGRTSRERALLCMDALLKALEHRGHNTETDTSPRRGRGTVVTVNGEQLSIRLRERLNRASPVMTKEERLRFERTGYEPYVKYDFHPSGDLQFEVSRPEYGWIDKTWKDGKRRKLEQILGKVVGGMEALADSIRVDRIRRAEEERLRAEEALRREEERRIQEEEAEQFAQLRDESKRWHEARALREYLGALEAIESDSRTSEFDEWLAWARQRVEELDPLSIQKTQ
jgi:hypothetical protein